MRLLLVEDDKNLGKATAEGLRESFAVDWVRTGEEGEEALSTRDYNLAIFDINLPGQSGLELLTHIRKKKSQLPVLILTARDAVRHRIEGLNSGADDYLVKPFDLDELLALYVAQFDPAQGLDPAAIRLEMDMLVGLLGICWLLDAVPLILREIPDLDQAEGPRDRRFVGNERARTQLHMLTVFMNLWETHDLGRSLDRVLALVKAA